MPARFIKEINGVTSMKEILGALRRMQKNRAPGREDRIHVAIMLQIATHALHTPCMNYEGT
eukprot:scaffold55413_cov22-Prasinocladus_malaysianus.AAC.1